MLCLKPDYIADYLTKGEPIFSCTVDSSKSNLNFQDPCYVLSVVCLINYNGCYSCIAIGT